jgi:segregation and condensation protein B
MEEREVRNVVEAALLAAAKPLSLDQLMDLFAKRGGLERAVLRKALDDLAQDYAGRGIEIVEVASGFRVQVRKSMSDWLVPLWEERAPRYTRALLETLALIAYRQPITRGEIEEIRGVVVSTNIVRTLLERGWVRVLGHRDVPGKPAMFGTTREFLDYFGLKRLEDLPPLSEIKDLTDPNVTLQFPEEYPQEDIVELLSQRIDNGERLQAAVDIESQTTDEAPNEVDGETAIEMEDPGDLRVRAVDPS